MHVSLFEDFRKTCIKPDYEQKRNFAAVLAIAKNYLSEKEVESLNRLSNAFIDIAEQNAEDHILMTMADWSILLQKYMDLNNRPMLLDTGQVTHEQAIEKALTEYDKFRVIQDREIMSDFDRQLKLLFGDKE